MREEGGGRRRRKRMGGGGRMDETGGTYWTRIALIIDERS